MYVCIYTGYFVGSVYVLIVITLYRVQTELANPFDGDGADDVNWDMWRAQLVCACMHMFFLMFACDCVWVCVSLCVSICMCLCVCECVCVCVYVCA